jgi:simple sugar transport system ATP-binding protein
MYVLRDGELVGELAEDQMNENAVMAAIAGGEKDE